MQEIEKIILICNHLNNIETEFDHQFSSNAIELMHIFRSKNIIDTVFQNNYKLIPSLNIYNDFLQDMPCLFHDLSSIQNNIIMAFNAVPLESYHTFGYENIRNQELFEPQDIIMIKKSCEYTIQLCDKLALIEKKLHVVMFEEMHELVELVSHHCNSKQSEWIHKMFTEAENVILSYFGKFNEIQMLIISFCEKCISNINKIINLQF